ncbi:MAG: nicotinate phosphoribosyltransferase [Chloroflexi bacterium]|nr:nicotinate phosphoribosyltransferase [Chloroflexota bacterium]MCH8893294.1 nicotinate phosphoribosyltransferase [Chloroflexota bacterium]MCI0800470.1 nicotinate phosphoribosyltransferase [Chloroflexota bacterium]MCI0811673.1 nicotinate phosphoribosyltransferase [Chloroflexota bacterium]MCI0828491.1 nicotinate phosphoribosyltransferase [Chloroflexota bacterium]
MFTDLYELTMSQAFLSQGMLATATFSLFTRTYPPNRAYFVSAGLEDVLDYLSNLNFSGRAIDYLRATGIFSGDFLDFLRGVRFTGSVRAIPEGRLYFADEPAVEITAPLIEAQLVETFIINQVNLQSMLATKAARCVWAAQGRGIADFASRRTQGTDAALKMARASYIAGFSSTSNVLAASIYGMPPAGTMAHSFISTFATELDAFRAYAQSFPGRTILLIDTYDTISGAWNAVQVAKEMEGDGQRLMAVRLDSGDFDELSRRVRTILDDSGLDYVKILASGGLDEYELETLVKAGAPIDLFGVGTKAGVSADAPWSDMAYKLVCFDGRPVMKLSPEKVSLPGAKQVFRTKDAAGMFARDIIALDDEELPGGLPLLEEVMKDGRRTGPQVTLEEVRKRFQDDFAALDGRFKVLNNPPRFPVAISGKLERLTSEVREKVMGINVSNSD